MVDKSEGLGGYALLRQLLRNSTVRDLANQLGMGSWQETQAEMVTAEMHGTNTKMHVVCLGMPHFLEKGLEINRDVEA